MRRATLALAALAAAAVAAPARPAHAAPPVEFSLKVTPTTGTVDDEFVATVQITIRGVNGADRFWEPDWGDFTVADKRTQQSTQWTYDPQNGQEVRSVEVRRFLLKPKRAGRIRVGEAKLRVDGVDYTTKPVVVEVLAAGQAAQGQNNPPGGQSPPSGQTPPPQTPGGYPPPDPSIVGPTFLHVVVDKPKVRVGEQVTVTWLLYTRAEVLKFEQKPPRFDDLWSETLYEPQNYLQYSEDVVNGRTYAVAVVSKKALFPTKAGKVVIPAFKAEVATMATPFGSPLRLSSKEIPLEVEALPPGAPPGFDPGMVGQFEIDAQIDRDNVPAGESLELTLTVRGQGAIRRTKTPVLAFDGFEVYPPRDFQERVDTTADPVRGERRYSYVLTPQKGGQLAIGPIAVPYFNLQTGRYDVARADALRVKVVGDPKAAGAGSSSENVIGRDIRPPHDVVRASPAVLAELPEHGWFRWLLLLPGAAFVGVIAVDWLREHLTRDTPRARLRRARGRARKRLRVAESHIKYGRASKFFAEIARVLTEHVEERAGEPVAALTRDQLRRLLGDRGFPPETIDAIVSELENCDFARFAPSASGPGEMRAAMRRVRDLLGAIERVRPPRVSGEEAAA
jgi:hypothetical protein